MFVHSGLPQTSERSMSSILAEQQQLSSCEKIGLYGYRFVTHDIKNTTRMTVLLNIKVHAIAIWKWNNGNDVPVW